MSKLNLLVAYPYMSKPVIELLKGYGDSVRFVLDSGAFTAWKAGKEITVDQYCKFIESLPFEPWRYFTLDVIGDPHGTLKNYQSMLDRGFKPVPIFTRGEDPSLIDHYYETSDVVGVGGLVGTRGNKGFVRGIMEHIGDRKVHWLGFTAHDFVSFYKPYMCDSSGWESGARYGNFNIYLGGGRFKRLQKKDFREKPPQYLYDAITSYGYDAKDFAKKEHWHGGASKNRALNAHSVVRYQRELEKKCGTYLFAAAATELAVKLLVEGALWEEKHG